MLVKHCAIWFLVIACCAGWASCSTHALDEAQAIVVTADSLWHNGQVFSDSARLAQAYHTLHQKNNMYPDAYAHACYHYGRLLRAQDDPVAAMQCFINATHSRTDDYHILGRVYSNMGDLCHMASEFQLAYDMYERCADMYMRNGDTSLHYYGLYHMAYELAEQGKEDSCFAIIQEIEDSNVTDKVLFTYCNLTKAEALLRNSHYNSAIEYAYQVKQYIPNLSAADVQLAQSYSLLGIKDSSVYYANMVLHETTELFEINNALYILTNDDDTKDKKAIRETASKRADTHKLLEIRQGELSQAVQLLEQDLNRKPNWRWLYSILATLAVVGTSIAIYVYRKRKHHRLLSQQLEDLTSAASDIQEKHKKLTARYQMNHERMEDDIKRKCAVMRRNPNLTTEMGWTRYDSLCHNIDQQFYGLASDLRSKQLNETEVRLCVLVLLDMSRAEIANMLPYALNSVGKLKDHTAKKLGTTGKNLRNYLLLAVIEG